MRSGTYFGRGVPFFLQTLDRYQRLYPLLREMRARGTLIAANCSSVFILAESQLLDGGAATTSWMLARAFRERFPQVQLRLDRILVEGDRLSCSGVTTAYWHQALRIVEKLAGADIAADVARLLLVDINRSSQAPYMALSLQDYLQHDDQLVMRAQEWIREHLQQAFSLKVLSAHVATSERTLIRRFNHVLGMTPTDYLQMLRVDFCKRLLENSSLAMDEVCERVGYGDASSFRRLFKRATGLSPRSYRAQFGRHMNGAPTAATFD
jgi:transcriptional regulator GlxA family with amidase domain